MLALSFVLSLAIVPFVHAQSSNPALEIAAIKAHFNNSGLTPSLLAQFDPTAVFTMNFEDLGNAGPGQALTRAQAAPAPNLTVTPAKGSYNATDLFTLAMVDAGPVGTDQAGGQTRHWLVNGVTLTGNSTYTVSITNGTAITEYAGPAPPEGSGAHRYVILLYSQPSTFQAPQGLDTPNIGVSVFNFPAYVQDSHLGSLVAGTYFTVEEGTASVAPSSTAPVVSSTLSVPTTASSTQTSSSPAHSTTAPPKDTSSASQVAPFSNGLFWSAVLAIFSVVFIVN